jgi:hypothetical protein
LGIHFIHVRSKHENALPLIVTHGWPGSITEQMKIIDPLTDPTAHGGNASDAFDVVIPSMPVSTCRSTITWSVNANVEPWPTCDLTQNLPPCISTMRFDMASPKPVPHYEQCCSDR